MITFSGGCSRAIAASGVSRNNIVVTAMTPPVTVTYIPRAMVTNGGLVDGR